MRLIRFILGLAFLPCCAGITRTAVVLLDSVQADSAAAVPASAWALGGGYSLWLLVYFTLPKPVRTYVLAHELTHALWGWVMGAEVLRMRVSKASGSVTLSRSNMFITLAPYFFPLYTVLAVVGYYGLSIFIDVERYYLFWLAIVGFTWGFHFTFTVVTLMQHQTDIKEYGHLFSYTIIYAFNVLGICLWIVMVASPSLEDMIGALSAHAAECYLFCRQAVAAAVGRINEYFAPD